MGEGQQQQLLFEAQHHQQQQRAAPVGRFGGVRGGGGAGEIVEVQGGHIVRSTGRKDRHSKVCTAKGPRDRRVRLAAHTAIQFYDVQDRLGYDRPSKAVDWLIKNAKAAIDELAELPPWHPTARADPPPPPSDHRDPPPEPTGKKPMHMAAETTFAFATAGGGGGSSSFLPPSLDSDAIADTIKSFFPMAATAAVSSSPPIGYQNYPPDLLSRTTSHAQDLRLSLQSFQDPTLFHHSQHTTHHHHHHQSPSAAAAAHHHQQPLLSHFDAASTAWSEHNHRLIPWNVGAETGTSGGGDGAGYLFNMPPQPSPPQAVPLHAVLGQSQLFAQQRGPLQSSHSPSARAWADPVEHPLQPHTALPVGFVSAGAGGFAGFHIPARIQGEDEEHDGGSSKPSSASSASHH